MKVIEGKHHTGVSEVPAAALPENYSNPTPMTPKETNVIWDAKVTYSQGQLVTRGQYAYISRIANNLNNDPNIAPAQGGTDKGAAWRSLGIRTGADITGDITMDYYRTAQRHLEIRGGYNITLPLASLMNDGDEVIFDFTGSSGVVDIIPSGADVIVEGTTISNNATPLTIAVNSRVHLGCHQSGWFVKNRSVGIATETAMGLVEIATQEEVDTGEDSARVVTAKTAKVAMTNHENSRNHPDASETAKGFVELATQTEVDTGTDTTRVLTPKTAAGRYSPIGHNHEISDVDGLQEALDEKQPKAALTYPIPANSSYRIFDFDESANDFLIEFTSMSPSLSYANAAQWVKSTKTLTVSQTKSSVREDTTADLFCVVTKKGTTYTVWKVVEHYGITKGVMNLYYGNLADISLYPISEDIVTDTNAWLRWDYKTRLPLTETITPTVWPEIPDVSSNVGVTWRIAKADLNDKFYLFQSGNNVIHYSQGVWKRSISNWKVVDLGTEYAISWVGPSGSMKCFVFGVPPSAMVLQGEGVDPGVDVAVDGDFIQNVITRPTFDCSSILMWVRRAKGYYSSINSGYIDLFGTFNTITGVKSTMRAYVRAGWSSGDGNYSNRNVKEYMETNVLSGTTDHAINPQFLVVQTHPWNSLIDGQPVVEEVFEKILNQNAWREWTSVDGDQGFAQALYVIPEVWENVIYGNPVPQSVLDSYWSQIDSADDVSSTIVYTGEDDRYAEFRTGLVQEKSMASTYQFSKIEQISVLLDTTYTNTLPYPILVTIILKMSFDDNKAQINVDGIIVNHFDLAISESDMAGYSSSSTFVVPSGSTWIVDETGVVTGEVVIRNAIRWIM